MTTSAAPEQVTDRTVRVYTSRGCGPCIATKRILDRLGVPFIEVGPGEGEEARAELRDRGFMQSPVVMYGDEVWTYGPVDPERLEKLAAVVLHPWPEEAPPAVRGKSTREILDRLESAATAPPTGAIWELPEPVWIGGLSKEEIFELMDQADEYGRALARTNNESEAA
jgi:glutaredoxin-like protein NrdH